MTEAKSLLKNENFQKELKPCREVLDLIYRASKTDFDSYTSEGLNPTDIAQKIYKDRYEELEKEFKTATVQIGKGIPEYKKLEKTFSRKKKLPMQVVSRKCRTLFDLNLIYENDNSKKGSDLRKTFYYPTQLGLDVNNIINIEGFPLIDTHKKRTKGKEANIGSKSNDDYIQGYKKVQHSLKLINLINELINGFPEMTKDGIYLRQNESLSVQYKGEEFEVELVNSHLYTDFFSNHLMFDKELLKKIETFKLKCKEFWENKNEIFEEMLLDLKNYFSSEISKSSDIEPLDENIRDWIYEGSSYLVQGKNRIFQEYFVKFNLELKIIDNRWIPSSKKGSRDWPEINILEYSVRSHRFISFTTLDENKISKSHLEKKLKDYVNDLQHRPYYEFLTNNIKLLDDISNLTAEIKDVLKRHILIPILPGECEYINPDIET